MTLFVRLLDVPVDDKAERLREAVQGEGGASMRRDPADMTNVPGAAFVYWLQPTLLDLFRGESRWEDFESRCGLGTLDDFRFLRLWWEVPSDDAGWVPFAKGGRFSPFHADIALKVNWHGGDELKASVERKVGSASRKVQGQEFYFREGLTWPRLPHVIGSFQFLPRGCIYSDGGPGIFSRDSSALGPLCAVLNSAPFLFLLECLMPRGSEGGQTLKYEAGYITSVPFPDLDHALADRLARLAEVGWELGLEKSRSSETSLRFAGPAPMNSLGAIDNRMTQILNECDALSAEALRLDELSIAEVAAWARLRRSQALPPSVEDEGARYASTYLSWCVGRAFGRFRPVEPGDGNACLGPFDALPELPPAASPSDGGATGPLRNILVDDLGHPEDIVTAVASFVAEDPEGVVDMEPDDLRVWLA